MANDLSLVIPGGLDGLANSLDAANQTTQLKGGGDPILRLMTDDGIFVYGAENIEMQEGSEWVLNTASLQHGGIAWFKDAKKNGQGPVAEIMGPVFGPRPDFASHKIPDDAEWRPQMTMQLKCLTGEDQGTQIVYKTTSHGGLDAVKKVITQIANKARTKSPFVFPGIVFSVSSYQNKNYNRRVYTPIMDIVHWYDMDGVEETQAVGQVTQAAVNADVPAKPKRAPVGASNAQPVGQQGTNAPVVDSSAGELTPAAATPDKTAKAEGRKKRGAVRPEVDAAAAPAASSIGGARTADDEAAAARQAAQEPPPFEGGTVAAPAASAPVRRRRAAV